MRDEEREAEREIVSWQCVYTVPQTVGVPVHHSEEERNLASNNAFHSGLLPSSSIQGIVCPHQYASS